MKYLATLLLFVPMLCLAEQGIPCNDGNAGKYYKYFGVNYKLVDAKAQCEVYGDSLLHFKVGEKELSFVINPYDKKVHDAIAEFAGLESTSRLPYELALDHSPSDKIGGIIYNKNDQKGELDILCKNCDFEKLNILLKEFIWGDIKSRSKSYSGEF